MNDALYEQLVTRKSKPADLIIRIVLIVFLVAVLCVGMLFLGFLAVPITVLLAFLVYYFIFSRLNVEYEYVLLNHDLEIDAIYNKEKRKKQITIDIQQAEIIAPQNSHRLDSIHAEKTKDFSSGTDSSSVYAIVIPVDQSVTRILIEPDEKMLDHMSQWMGMKLQRN